MASHWLLRVRSTPPARGLDEAVRRVFPRYCLEQSPSSCASCTGLYIRVEIQYEIN